MQEHVNHVRQDIIRVLLVMVHVVRRAKDILHVVVQAVVLVRLHRRHVLQGHIQMRQARVHVQHVLRERRIVGQVINHVLRTVQR